MVEIRAISERVEPHNTEAEQQLLGAILLGQSTGPVEAAGGEDIFYEKMHAEIYKTCRSLERADRVVSAITVKSTLSDDAMEAMQDLGGAKYLVRLAGCAISSFAIADYAELVAEESAKRKLLDIIHNAQAAIAKRDLGASDVAAQMEAAFDGLGASKSRIKPVSIMEATTDALKRIYGAHSNEEVQAVPSGLSALDRLIIGFEPGDMWLLGGRPSMGKTSVALSFGLNAARMGYPVIIASLEMTPEAMAIRALSEGTSQQKCATPYFDLRRGVFSPRQDEALRAAAKEIAHLPIMFLPHEYQDCDLLQVGVKQTLRQFKTDNLPLVIIDYAQLMRSKARSRYEQITDVSLTLKGMARSLSLPVVALSQLSRALEQREDKRPMLSDLRESGQLEQDADGVMFCYREEYYLEREEPDPAAEAHITWQAAMEAQRNKLEVIVAKQRQGPIGVANLRCNLGLNRVWE